MKSPGTLSLGRVYCDLNFSGISGMPVLGQELFADELTLHAGGGAYITASYLRALGINAFLMGMLPRFPFSTLVQAEAAENRLDLQYCQIETNGSPQITAALCLNDERAFLTSRGGAGLPHDYADVIEHCIAHKKLAHIHIGELATLIDHPDILELAKHGKLSVSLDCGWDEASFSHPDVANLIAQVDVFLPNQMEMERLLTMGIEHATAPLTVVKQGASGATAYRGAEFVHGPGEAIAVVDTIGAGDAFNAGFLSAWLAGQSLNQSLQKGNSCGAVAVSRRGGCSSLPELADITPESA